MLMAFLVNLALFETDFSIERCELCQPIEIALPSCKDPLIRWLLIAYVLSQQNCLSKEGTGFKVVGTARVL